MALKEYTSNKLIFHCISHNLLIRTSETNTFKLMIKSLKMTTKINNDLDVAHFIII